MRGKFSRAAWPPCCGLRAWCCPGVRAEDRISVRGAYFREASNRVVQPMMEVTKDLPGGYDIGGHFLVDAISSASIAQGALVDEVFTETRYEGSLSVGRTLGPAPGSAASCATATSPTTTRTPGACRSTARSGSAPAPSA